MGEDQGAVAVVKKKRKTWWIAGSAALLLFTLLAGLTAATNTPDARLERAIAEAVDEFGLEMTHEFSSDELLSPRRFREVEVTVMKVYSTELRDRADEARLVALFMENCKGCTVEYRDSLLGGHEGSDGTLFETDGSYRTIKSVQVGIDEAGSYDGTAYGAELLLTVHRRRDAAESIWKKIRAWLPW